MKNSKYKDLVYIALISFGVGIVTLLSLYFITNYLYVNADYDFIKKLVGISITFRGSLGRFWFYLIFLALFTLVCFLIIYGVYKIIHAKVIFNNKNVLKILFRPIIIFIVSYIVISIVLSIIEMTANYYNSFGNGFLYGMSNLWFLLERYDVVNIVKWIAIITLYLKISKSRACRVQKLFEDTKEMAEGNMDINISDNGKDEISCIAGKIDNIVTKLKNITIEERNAERTKNDLITNVSHDLRTPLTSIVGYLSLIDSDKYKDEVELRYYVSIAYEKSKELDVLINDLFKLTKMQNYEVTLNKTKINLIELLGQVEAEFQYMFSVNDIIGRVDFCEDKLIVNADAKELVRVFENLISNSIKYGSDGKYIDITAEKKDNKAIVRIINYGDEIPQSELSYIFDRFYRVEKSRNREKGGSGLGLAIAKNIVELHEGKIKAYSNEEKTIFEVELGLE